MIIVEVFVKSISRAMFPLCLTIVTLCQSARALSDEYSKEQFYGTWNCVVVDESVEGKIVIDLDVSYAPNSQMNSSGSTTLFIAGLPEIKYSIAFKGVWEYQDGYLIETSNEVKIVNISHPELDELLNPEGLFPESLSESTEVIMLTESSLTLKSEGDNVTYSCDKLASKRLLKVD